MKALLVENQKLFGLMRLCGGCRHTNNGVYPCQQHLEAAEYLNARWKCYDGT